MARRLFIAVFSVSALLSLVFGVAVAWTQSASTSTDAYSGALQVGVYNVQHPSNKLYPTGTPIQVLTGQIINNTAANPGIPVFIRDGNNAGSVTVTGSDVAGCTAGYINGDVTRTSGAWINPGGYAGGGWAVNLTMSSNAPDACQGATIHYNYTVNVQTP